MPKYNKFRSINDLKAITGDSKSDTSLKKIHPSELELIRNVDYIDDLFPDFGNGNQKNNSLLSSFMKKRNEFSFSAVRNLLYSVNHITTKLLLGQTFFHSTTTNPSKDIIQFYQ